ncbi:MAG: hypothetical protein RRA32_04940 [bacterium]|nr:hypothetical protein [bacterium]
MKLPQITIAVFLILSLSGLSLSQPIEVDDTQLSIDFTNNESRSVSVRLGSADGITADMNFAVLDSMNRQIALFFPREILGDRFWSGPLDRADYARVRAGDRVIALAMTSEQAGQLRSEFAVRLDALKAERRQRRIEKLKEDVLSLKDVINDRDVDDVALKKDLDSLQTRLKKEKDIVKRDVDEIQEQVITLRDERTELMEERAGLLDRRDTLRRRSDPSQDRVNDLNEKIADLDREIGQLNNEMDNFREEIRELRENTLDLEEEVRVISSERSELAAERKELVLELGELEEELEKLKRSGH